MTHGNDISTYLIMPYKDIVNSVNTVVFMVKGL